jgi:hypothetical protein
MIQLARRTNRCRCFAPHGNTPGWVVVDVLDEPAAGGQRILRIQSPDGSEETLVTSQVALFGLGDPD